MNGTARSPSPTADLALAVERAIKQLTQTYDDIGYTTHEKDNRAANVYKALQDTLKEQLTNTNKEKEKLVEECTGLIQQIRQMKKSIDDYDDDQSLRITLPLIKCRQELRDKMKTTTKMHAKRFEQIQELTRALRKYSDALEPSFIRLELPPNEHSKALSFNLSHAYVNALDQEFNRVYEEYQRRTRKVQEVATEIVQLWAELGTHSSQTDRKVLECYKQAPEQLGLRGEDIRGLQSKLRHLREEKDARERRIAELHEQILMLWEKLNIDEDYRNHFLATHRSVSQKTILEIEQEAERLQQLKKDNLHIFVEDARQTLQRLWDELYYSEDEMIEFTAAFTTDYTDALLTVHEAEIARLEELLEERQPILILVDKYRSLLNDQEQLAISATDSSRLTARGANRDPTRLLREERMRKRITKELPKVEQDLRMALEQYEEQNGCPFLVKGEDYLETVLANSTSNTTSTTTGTSKPSMSRLNSKPSMHALKSAPPSTNNATGTQTRGARSQSVREQKSTPRLNGQPVLKHSTSAASTSNRLTTTTSNVPLRPKTPTVSRPKTPGASRPKTPTAQTAPYRRPQTSHAMRPKTPTAAPAQSRNGSVSSTSGYSRPKTPARTSRGDHSPESNTSHNMNGGMNRSSIASSTTSTNTTATSVATSTTSYSKTGSIRRKMPPPPASAQMIGKLVPTHTGSSNGSGAASPTFSRRPQSYAAPPQARSRGGSIDQSPMMAQGRSSNEGTPSGMPSRWHNGAYLRNGASQYRPPSQQSHASTAYSHDSRDQYHSQMASPNHHEQHQRLFSGASSGGESSTTVVSSENWETYDTDGEDDGEGDAGYDYATIRAKQAFAAGLGRSTIASTIAIVGGDHHGRHDSDLGGNWIET